MVKENTQLQLTKSALESRCKELDDIARRDSQQTLAGVKERDQLIASKNALEAHVKELNAKLKQAGDHDLVTETKLAALESQIIGLEDENRKLRAQAEVDKKSIDALKVQGKKDTDEIARLKKLLEELQMGKKTVGGGACNVSCGYTLRCISLTCFFVIYLLHLLHTLLIYHYDTIL